MSEEEPLSDDALQRAEREILDLNGSPVVDGERASNPTRIERIVERAGYETVVKDTTSFLFNSFSTAITGLFAAVLGGRGVAQLPPPPSDDHD